MEVGNVFLFIISVEVSAFSSAANNENGQVEPLYLWPLGNSSVKAEVMQGNDLTFGKRDGICFIFREGPAELPYRTIRFSGDSNSYFDTTITATAPFKDITISIFIFPEGDVSGTIINYEHNERELIRVRCITNTFLISFRDEYGMSAGMMFELEFLKPEVWNHVVITRDYETGRIIVYMDGAEVYNKDDDFSDAISFSSKGNLRIGLSQDEEEPDAFTGSLGCLQLYSTVIGPNQLDLLRNYCLPNNWKVTPKIYLEKRDGKSCLGKDPGKPEVAEDPVTMTTVMRGGTWKAFLRKFQLVDSGNNSGYFSVTSVGKKPSTDESLLARFNATGVKVCSRLCMRVSGCKAFVLNSGNEAGQHNTCSLFEQQSEILEPENGSKYYTLKHQ